jgi:N-acyl-D-aspartate/D-glutamate deacylase
MAAHAYDIVLRGGLVYDGSGGAPYEADVAVKDGLIAAIGPNLPQGREEVDARGMIVTPGFVDIHTHYDGQATAASVSRPASRRITTG